MGASPDPPPTPPRRGRPPLGEATINVSLRLKTTHYDAMYREASRSRMKLSDWMRWRLRVAPPPGQ